ncbi:MAG: sce7725 family protein [Bacteroidetes bacterium]|nr:sce7725 family protein [Bacteroidota bacterium]
MYFPFLRGKQFELIALRESVGFLGENIIPVIEPVKRSLVSLKKCLGLLNESDVKVILIANPKVGELKTTIWKFIT